MENIQDIYPLSPMQQGMLFHTIYAPETEVYAEQICCDIHGNINVEAFKFAWQQLLNRHDILRSAFIWEDVEEPLQVVHTQLDIPFSYFDWHNDADVEQKIEKLRQQTRIEGFELNNAPLIKVTLIKKSSTSYAFIFTHHHILIDGWATPIIFSELFKLYDAHSTGGDLQLEFPRPYGDYINWLAEQDMEAAKSFWKARLNGINAPTPLSFGKKNIPNDTGYKIEHFHFTEHLSTELQNFTKTHQVTLNTIMQAAWGVLLARYNRMDDVLFGATVSGRPPEIAGIETMVGLFINTLPVRVMLNNQTFLELVKQLQMQQAETRQYEFSPLVEVQAQSAVPRDMPLFNSLLVFENYPVDETMKQQESALKITNVQAHERTNYPLTLVTAPGKQMMLTAAYETGKFHSKTIHRLFGHMQTLLLALVHNPQQNPTAIALLGMEEKELVLNKWNKTEGPYEFNSTIHAQFEANVLLNPNNTALYFKGKTLSYNQLNKKANQLAHLLIQKGYKAETPIAICMERSMEMVIASLAVLKAGLAYVPIDSSYPKERINYIIEDSKAALVIASKQTEALLNIANNRLLIYAENKLENAPNENPNGTISPENLAYIIYTSGSTGKPKGVLLQHKGLINTITAQRKDFKVDAQSRIMQFASFSFDASVCEIFLALLNGAQLHLIEKDIILSKDALIAFMLKQEISLITFPPSLLAMLSDQEFPALKTVVTVGEACSRELAEKWHSKTLFINGYGPTEATIGCVWGRIKQVDFSLPTAPIGIPILNDKAYILDENGLPTPIGCAGELYIASPGLARGYLDRADLTAEKFIPNPFSQTGGERLYKTGDLACWLPDGRIEFMGRVDFQVKIRGNRIELGEIEAAINSYPAIKDVIVRAFGQNAQEKQLVAFVISKEENISQQVRSHIQNSLPEYMIPTAIIELESFPLTPNGKVDRNALTLPSDFTTTSSRVYVAPQSQTEQVIASIWQDVLNGPQVGLNDNFFALGGHSLLATQVVSRMRDAFELEVPIKLLFETTHLAHLASKVEQLRQNDTGLEIPAIIKVDRNQPIPLSFAQQRLWFLDQLQPGGTFYNIPGAFKISGTFNPDRFKQVLKKLIDQEEIFRTRFEERSGQPQQIISGQIELPLVEVDLSQIADSEAAIKQEMEQESRHVFNLATGPLLRVKLLKLNNNSHIVLFTIHHIIADGWSMGLLIKRIAALYQNPEEAYHPNFHYADFSIWQNSWLTGPILEVQKHYWHNKIGPNPDVLALPTDFPRPKVQTFNGHSIKQYLSPQLSTAIKQLSAQNGSTVFITLLAAYNTLLYRYTGQKEIIVGAPIANRRHAETEEIIGFFVNNLVLKNSIDPQLEFADFLRAVRTNVLEAYQHQDIPFEQLVDALISERNMSHPALFQTMFAYQNLPTSSVKSDAITLEALESETHIAKFDLSVTMAEEGESLGMQFEYNSDLFKPATMERMMGHFISILEQVCANSELTLAEIDFIPVKEKEQLLQEFNPEIAAHTNTISVPAHFKMIAEKFPQNNALTDGTTTLTYSELNQLSDALAKEILNHKLAPETIVGICMQRSMEMIIAMLATLKAGAAFLPLDPSYPKQRLNYMAEDANLKLILCDSATNIEQIFADNFPHLVVNKELLTEPEIKTSLPAIHPDQLAYVIYTSGSTGKPKGTLLTHTGMINLAAEQARNFNIDGDSHILQFASLSFDAAVWETVMALLNGATLSIINGQTQKSPELLLKTIENRQITTVTLPPSVLAVWPEHALPKLKTIITAGEAISADLVNKWGKNRQFVNAYGPTETTVCATMYHCNPPIDSTPPIGKPLAGFKAYILDENGYGAALGVAGELCISGVGLARGYHNRPDITAEKFIPHPFAQHAGERLYKTGDLARYLPNGDIEFLGRIDDQVKIRGHRIEIGEVEAALTALNTISDAIVLAQKQNGMWELLAWYVSQTEISATQIKQQLEATLPDYMVPNWFTKLESMPLTPNGKIDKKALPKAEQDRSQAQAEYVAPRNEVEKELEAIACNLLNIPKAGVYDSFFELGGHSLLATQFVSRIREKYEIELPLLTLFENPTIAALSDAVEVAVRSGVKSKPKIEKIERGNGRSATRPARRRRG